tara:strand:+ start:336 stop:629 length:294 start_codon:yes stop_codon:yes gene_type:complete
MTFYGKYGNANIFYTSDWSKITEYTSDDTKDELLFSKLGETEWDASSGTCKVWSSVLIKIVYHGMGFKDNKQQYIVDIQKQAVAEEWKYPAYIPSEE